MDARAARLQRADRTERWASILVGLAVVFVVSWMTLEASHPAARRDRGADAGAAAARAIAMPDAGAAPTAEREEPDGGLQLPIISLGDAAMLMPSGAPRQVKIGVVLVAFQGAEGAAPNARNKRDALTLAEQLGQEARLDFHHAVTAGDSGSSDDIGRLPRGVLDPRTEIAVFALAPGEVSDVLETPRGYWIVKRIE
jgi:hypothetical protein